MISNLTKNLKSTGFTLIETIVVTSITALVLITLGWLITYFYKTSAYALEESAAVNEARSGVRDIVSLLREASHGSDGSYPIRSAATSSITFYANTNDDMAIERVTYSLMNRILYRIIETPTGNPLTYAFTTISTTTISAPVTNGTSTPMFRYFNSSGAELAVPVNISEIASVRATIVIDVNVDRSPVAFTLSGGATLRNLRNTR